MQPGFKGYHHSIEKEKEIDSHGKCYLWDRLVEMHHNGSLLGTSIQPDPGGKGPKGAEHDVGQGLNQKHAYSFVDLREIDFGDIKVPGYEREPGMNKFKLGKFNQF